MIRACNQADLGRIYEVINDAATAYEGVIPADSRRRRAYMPMEELEREARRMIFYGWEEEGRLTGVIGSAGGRPRWCWGGSYV